MEIAFIGVMLLGAILFVARYVKKSFKEGKSCPSCHPGSSKCNKVIKYTPKLHR